MHFSLKKAFMFLVFCFIKCTLSYVILFFVQCRQHPEQYEYFNSYDNLEVDDILFSYVLLACFSFYVVIALFFN